MSSPLTILASIAERKIAEAIQQGEFDNLRGQGRPMELEDDSMIPEDLRMAYKVLRNSGFIPPELATRKEITHIVQLLENCEDTQEKVRQMRKLNVILDRVNKQRNRPVYLEDADPYYARIVDRVSVIKKQLAVEVGAASPDIPAFTEAPAVKKMP